MPEDISSHKVNKSYWESFFDGFTPCHFPALDGDISRQDDFHETSVELDINHLVIQKFCLQHKVTLSSLLQLSWAIVISNYIGVDDVCFGYSRDHGDEKSDNMFVCRTKITTESLLGQTMIDMKKLDSIFAQDNFSVVEIQKRLGLQGKQLFNVGLQIQHLNGLREDCTKIVSQGEQNSSLTDLDFLARISITENSSITLSFRTRMSKFSGPRTADVAYTFGKTICECLRAHPQSRVGDLDIVSKHDYEKIMTWNRSFPQASSACFHQIFEDVAQKMAESPAICSWDGNLTYQGLDTLSTKLANHLTNLGVVPEIKVPICFDKSSTAIISMLGILKAGGAFVAIDPSYPASRIQTIVEATHASIVVAEPAHCHLFKGLMKHIVTASPEIVDQFPLTSDVARSQSSPSNTAYVVFTSGSTGTPKGIVVEHRALSTASRNLALPMKVTSVTRFLQFAAYTFDLSYGDIFITLSQGGCICIPSEYERVNDLVGAIVRMNVNTACLVPSVASIFKPEDVPGLKNLLLGGEALLQENLDVWADKVSLVSLYGPAECTVWCTAQTDLKVGRPANNIGRAVGVKLWVTNIANYDRLCPIGCIGELLIEGPVLARGYLNAEQTKASFVENPSWVEAERGQCRRFYKTGDLVKYNMDGTLSFVGRKDTQVKFHGRRIELGEIEYHLASHDLINQSIVMLPAAGIYRQRLVALVVLKANKASAHSVDELKPVSGIAKEKSNLELVKIKDYLSTKIPSYMLPQFWVVVENIPLMISGKMNRVLARKFLENLSDEVSQDKKEVDGRNINGDVDLGNPVEIHLRNIWNHALGKDITDNEAKQQSLTSLGGDSLTAMEIVTRCRAEGLALDVGDILNSTIWQMASVTKMALPEVSVVKKPVQEVFKVQSSCKLRPVWWT